MADNFNDWQKYVISRLDDINNNIAKLEVTSHTNLVKSHSKLDEKITKVRVQLGGMIVIIAIVTSAITATLTTSVKKVVRETPAIIDSRNKE